MGGAAGERFQSCSEHDAGTTDDGHYTGESARQTDSRQPEDGPHQPEGDHRNSQHGPAEPDLR
jgi:hypothetical protein